MGNYSGNHPRFSRRQEERYDAKEAHNKDLSDSARLHYLENDETHHPAKQNLADSRDIKDMSGAYNAMGDANHPPRQKIVDGKEVTWDPKHEDLSMIGKGLNNMTIDFNDGRATRPGDHLYEVARRGGPRGSVNKWGETKIGANFFPPTNKVDGKVVKVGPNQVMDYDEDGDTMFNDSNQDGTMLGRGIRRIQNYFSR
jgi:hypothetical protein